jgi:thiol-disulfide isomerase/thioredoxin
MTPACVVALLLISVAAAAPSAAVTELRSAADYAAVLAAHDVVLLNLYAPGCDACDAADPFFTDAAAAVANRFASVTLNATFFQSSAAADDTPLLLNPDDGVKPATATSPMSDDGRQPHFAFARIDAAALTDVTNRFEIEKLPAVVMFVRGAWYPLPIGAPDAGLADNAVRIFDSFYPFGPLSHLRVETVAALTARLVEPQLRRDVSVVLARFKRRAAHSTRCSRLVGAMATALSGVPFVRFATTTSAAVFKAAAALAGTDALHPYYATARGGDACAADVDVVVLKCWDRLGKCGTIAGARPAFASTEHDFLGMVAAHALPPFGFYNESSAVLYDRSHLDRAAAVPPLSARRAAPATLSTKPLFGLFLQTKACAPELKTRLMMHRVVRAIALDHPGLTFALADEYRYASLWSRLGFRKRDARARVVMGVIDGGRHFSPARRNETKFDGAATRAFVERFVAGAEPPVACCDAAAATTHRAMASGDWEARPVPLGGSQLTSFLFDPATILPQADPATAGGAARVPSTEGARDSVLVYLSTETSKEGRVIDPLLRRIVAARNAVRHRSGACGSCGPPDAATAALVAEKVTGDAARTGALARLHVAAVNIDQHRVALEQLMPDVQMARWPVLALVPRRVAAGGGLVVGAPRLYDFSSRATVGVDALLAFLAADEAVA